MFKICRAVWFFGLLAGCTAPVGEVDLGVAQQGADVAVLDHDRAGQSPIGDCSPGPLSIDPRWDSETAELIREAARWWEDAVGVDLGELPTAAEPCEREARVAGCIARRDVHVHRADTRPAGIDVYVDTIRAHGGGYDTLQRVVAHEVGHWIGIGDHADSGVMATGVGVSWSGELTDVDIKAYETECVDQLCVSG